MNYNNAILIQEGGYMITCVHMDKSEKEKWLPVLFDLFYENMSAIAPSGLPREEERACWLAEVSPALDKDPRQILLCRDGEHLLGYIQYYTREGLLMIEEFQIVKPYQKSLLFPRMCKSLLRNLPAGIETVEAYAHIPNLYSQSIMAKFGFRKMDACPYPGLVHLRANAAEVKKRFKR